MITKEEEKLCEKVAVLLDKCGDYIKILEKKIVDIEIDTEILLTRIKLYEKSSNSWINLSNKR